MRRTVLHRSVTRLLAPGERLVEAAFMWCRRDRGYLVALVAGIGLVAVAAVAGFEQWTVRLVIGLAGASIALTAMTDYRVLALTDQGLVLCHAARLRQVARRIARRLPEGTEVAIVRDTLITTDWRVDGNEYTVPKGSQRAMERIAATRPGGGES